MTKRQIIFIGCGTGRSGTVSLSKLLARCRNFHCTHEYKPMLSWKINEDAYENRKKYFLGANMDIGDVHSVYLPYLKRFIEDIPYIKIVCTRRDNEEVVKSFEKKINDRNHWYNHKGVGWTADSIWDPTFPTYNITDRHEAIEEYVKNYNRRIDRLAKKYPQNILVVDMNELNTFMGQNKIFNFVGIHPLNRSYVSKKRAVNNQSEDASKELV